MATTTDFTNFANERPNYFPGQYLLEDDFELEHKYLSDRQRYYNQSLHISGIIEGLEVEVIQDKKAVLIKSGSAININGELIVLKQDITFSDFKNITNGELYIQYSQKQQVKQQEDVTDSYTRWIENPILGFTATTPENSVKLAKLTISQDTITLDANVREYSGLSLPNSNSKALTLRSGGNANSNLAVLTGSLKIDGNLEVNNNILVKGTTSSLLGIGDEFSEGNTSGNREWMKRGVRIFWNSDNLFIGLKDEGSNRKDAVVAWGDDPQEDLRFINIQSGGAIEGNEVIRVKANGNVGIGTNNPGNYKLNVQGNQLLNGSLNISETSSPLNPVAKLDISTATRTGNHPNAVKGLYVTGDFNADSDGIEFRHTNGTQGIGFGFNTIYAAGSNNDQDLNLKPKGTGKVITKGSLSIQEGKINLNGNQQIVFTDIDATNNLKIQLWTGYGLGINSSTLFYTANGNHSWRDHQNNERMLLATGANGGLTVKGTGTSSFAGNLTVTGSLSVGVSVGSTTNIDLSGHVQLKEYGQQKIAFLQARDDSSNRDIGLRIRTQTQGSTQRTLVDALTITPSGEIQGKIWYSNEYVWSNGQPEVKMGHSSKCVAFITYVQGKFAGGGEQVFTYIKSDGYWYLGGKQGSAGADIVAKARCIGSPD